MAALPTRIDNIETLDDWLSRPTPAVHSALEQVPGDLMVLGAGGKMGPTLTQMLKRAAPERRVLAVSRFSDPALPDRLGARDIEVLSGDLLDSKFLRSLPDCPNIFYLAGMKFGATGNQPLTWAMNAWLPGTVCQRFPQSRIVALSTGNVYGLRPVTTSGASEDDTLAPVGEYANSCLGRERLFEHFSHTQGTLTAIVRLNYANELRYGVLVDLAQKILSGTPVDLTMGWVNLIWQGDANAQIIASLSKAASPPQVLNVAGCPAYQVRHLCQKLGECAGVTPQFVGTESGDALLSDGSLANAWFGSPQVTVEHMIPWIIDWLQKGGPTLDKPTKFENRQGNF